MAHIHENPDGNGDQVKVGNGVQIKVGTRGTVSSLMSRELESAKQSAQASPPTSRKKLQDPPVSVPCGYSPKRTQPRRSSPNDPGSSSGGCSGCRSPADVQKPKPKPKPSRTEHRSPMLATAETTTLEKNAPSKEKLEKKKGRNYIAEVVDLKCNSPMGSRLKKLGFSKLSESAS